MLLPTPSSRFSVSDIFRLACSLHFGPEEKSKRKLLFHLKKKTKTKKQTVPKKFTSQIWKWAFFKMQKASLFLTGSPTGRFKYCQPASCSANRQKKKKIHQRRNDQGLNKRFAFKKFFVHSPSFNLSDHEQRPPGSGRLDNHASSLLDEFQQVVLWPSG